MPFPKDFLWGAASAALQVEGAYDEAGKGAGIWDVLTGGQIKDGSDAKVACDHYHRYKEDVALMKQIGLKAYRFSVSWPRVMPEDGVVNPSGLEFYVSLVDELIAAGIEPMVTLFHWNLPMWAYRQGGWLNRKIADWFAD
jgi:beta-glucosidase